MPANFSRLKTWASLEVLTNEDLNAEFDNIINSLSNTTLDDYSTNVAQMQLQTSPGTVGSESLATSIAGELERIRFVIARIIGKTYWYDTPTRVLEAYTPTFNYYFNFDGATALDATEKTITRGAMPNGEDVMGNNLSTSSISSTQKKFGNFSFQNSTSESLHVHGISPQNNKNTSSLFFYAINSSQGFFYNPQLGIEAYLTAAGFIEFKITERTPVSNTAKRTKTVTGNSSVSGLSAWNHVNFKYTMNGASGSGLDRIRVRYNGATVGTDLTSQTINVNVGDGGQWIYNARKQDPVSYDTSYAANVIASSDGFTKTGTGVESVSDGVLTLTTAFGSEQLLLSKTSGVNISAGNGFCADFKMRVGNYVFNNGTASAGDFSTTPVLLRIRDDSENRSLTLYFHRNSIVLQDSTSSSGLRTVHNDCSVWHTYRVTIDGDTKEVILYIDGQRVTDSLFSLSIADATAGDLLAFGDDSSAGVATANSEWEYLNWGSGTKASYVRAPYTLTNSGYFDDISSIADDYENATLDNSLTTLRASDVFLNDKPKGPFWKMVRNILSLSGPSGTWSITATSWTSLGTMNPWIVGDGKTPVLISGSLLASMTTSGQTAHVLYDVDLEGQWLAGTSAQIMGYAADQQPAALANDQLKIVPMAIIVPRAGARFCQLLSYVSGGTATFQNSQARLTFTYLGNDY